MVITILTWVAAISSIGGNLGVIYKKLWGMQLWTIGSVLWIIYALQTKNHAQLAMFLIYTGLNIKGWIEWSKEK